MNFDSELWMMKFQEWLWESFIENLLKARRKGEALVIKQDVLTALFANETFQHLFTFASPQEMKDNPIFMGSFLGVKLELEKSQ